MTKTSKQQIITTAAALIMAQNNAEVSLSSISNALGITHGALYKHFQSKQALWTAVATDWFNNEILNTIKIETTGTRKEQLHDWLWAFVNAKKAAYQTNAKMFTLNTKYIDNDPRALNTVLQGAYAQMNAILGITDEHSDHAEMILATFAILTLPNFKETWNDPQYAQRFEAIWDLIKEGI